MPMNLPFRRFVFALLPAAIGGMLLFGDERMRNPSKDVSRQVVPQVYHGADVAGETAMAWLREVVAEEYLPPKGTRFFLVPHRGGDDCDTAGLSYVAAGAEVEVIQIQHFMAIQISSAAWKKGATPTFAEIQKIAKAVFRNSDQINLSIDEGTEPLVQEGATHSVPRRGDPWFKRIQWRQDQGRLVFWFLKHPGEPVMAVMTSDLRGNRHWFTREDKVDALGRD